MRSDGGPEIAVHRGEWLGHPCQSRRRQGSAGPRGWRGWTWGFERWLDSDLGPLWPPDRGSGGHRIWPHRCRQWHPRYGSRNRRLCFPGRRRRSRVDKSLRTGRVLSRPRSSTCDLKAHSRSAQRIQRRPRRAYARRCEQPGHRVFPDSSGRAALQGLIRA